MTGEDDSNTGIERRLLLRTLGAGALAGVGDRATAGRARARTSERLAREIPERRRDDGQSRCVVDDFQDGDLDEYVARDGPKASWRVASFRNGRVLEFQGGDGADLQSYSGLGTYPRRGDRFSFLFYPYGNWDGYAMFSFGIADPENFQRRYELEFEPAESEVRLQYSRAPGDEETIASASRSFDDRDRQIVEVDWAASSDELVVSVADPDGNGTTLRASEPDDAPTGGGIGFYANGDAAWLFDYVTILDCDDRNDRDDGDDDGRDVFVVDDFEDGDLDEYDARDGPKSNWAVVGDHVNQGRYALQFQGGDGADLQSYSGLERYPRRGDRFKLMFGTFGNWDGYAMFSFGIADPDNFQRRYELEFEPAADEVRLQYSRAPGDEETIASTSVDLNQDWYYVVTVDWAASSDDIVVTIGTQTPWVELRAPEPHDAPTDGGIGFYASGDAAWTFDDIRILDQSDDGYDGGGNDADWPTFQHDFANTGWNRGTTGPTDEPTEAWATRVGRDTVEAPVVVDDTVYVSGNTRNVGLHALDAATGRVRWRYGITGHTASRPTVVDGTAYVMGGDSHGHAVDVDTGARRWRVKFPDDGTVAPVVADGLVFFGHYYGRLVAVDDAGRKRFGVPVGDLVTVDPAFADGVLYAGHATGRLRAFDIEAGQTRWERFEREGWLSQPTVVGETVYVTYEHVDRRNGGVLYALDASDGSVRWRFGGVGQDGVAVADGSVFVAAENGDLVALDATDGSREWRTRIGREGSYHALCVVNDVVYIPNSEAEIIALDAVTGAVTWTYDTHFALTGALAVADGTIYVPGMDGRVHALREP